MRLLLLAIFGAWAGLAIAETPTEEAGADSARRLALELAGAFANDGFRLRDGFVTGEIESGKPVVVEVNLFRGNAYWFIAAPDKPGRRLAMTIHDSEGKPLVSESWAEEAAVAAGVEPAGSGRFYIRLEQLEGSKGPFCLIYSYK